MTQKEAVREACRIVALAYRSIGDYTYPSDGFCDDCPFSNEPSNYKNAGKALDYVRQAVVERLEREGKQIASGFGPDGRELGT